MLRPVPCSASERSRRTCRHEFRNVVHQRLVARHLGRGRKRLVDDEMVVAFEGMPVDAGVVAVTGDQRLQFGRGAGQVLDVESNVLAQAGGPGGTAAAHRREDARTDGPIFRLLGRIVRKTCGNVEREPPQQLPDTGDIGGQLLRECGSLVSVSRAVNLSPVVSPTDASDLRSSISAPCTMRCSAESCNLRISTTGPRNLRCLSVMVSVIQKQERRSPLLQR